MEEINNYNNYNNIIYPYEDSPIFETYGFKNTIYYYYSFW